MKCESIDGSYGIFQSPHCVWVSSIDWCMVSVVGARSGEQSPQPARWIGVFVMVARSDEYWTTFVAQQSLTSERGEKHYNMLGVVCRVAQVEDS